MRKLFYLLSVVSLMIGVYACEKADVGQKNNGGDMGEKDAWREVTTTSSKWISKVLDYRPAPGQFINTSMADAESVATLVGKGEGIVSLGGYGGYIVFQFDHTVANIEGYDFLIKGNAFTGNSEPGIVLVSFDDNGNAIADDTWYELAGESYSKAVKNYTITYTKPSQTEKAEDINYVDSNGEGVFKVNDFHHQCYWPNFLTDNPGKLTFTGSRLEALSTVNDMGIWFNASAGKGYADDYSEEYPEAIGDDKDTKNSNKFDISNAVDKDGKGVELKGVDFVKVYNCVNQDAGWLGEISTEVGGAISLSVK